MSTTQPPEPEAQAAEHAASLLYQQVLTLLRQGDIAGAQRAIAQITHPDYASRARQQTAKAQVQAGDLAGAEATAQAMPYWDTRGEEVGKIAQAYLTRGDVAKAQQLAATLRSAYAWPGLMEAIAQAQVRAGAAREARATLAAAQQHVQTWSGGDHWNGYPREEALCQLVRAQMRLGDVTGATQTARSIARPEYQSQALKTIEALAATD
jgi:hypothetical protein